MFPRLSPAKRGMNLKGQISSLRVNAPSKESQDKLTKILGITNDLSVFFLLRMKSLGTGKIACFK